MTYMYRAEELVRVDSDILFMLGQFEKYSAEWTQFEFIFGGYQTQFYYWELVEILRKQLIVAVSSLLNSYGQEYEMIFGCTVSFVFFALHCSALPYVEPRENFIKGGEIGTTYLTLFLIVLRYLVEGNSEYSRSVLGYLNNGTTAIFITVVGTSLVWNFNAGLAELEAMKAEALAEAEGGVSKLDFFAVVCAVKLINRCVRNRIAMRYNWDQASSIGGDSLVSSRAASSHSHQSGTPRSTARSLALDEEDPKEGGAMMQPHVRERWQGMRDKLILIDGIPEPDYTSQESEVGLMSEDTESVMDEIFGDDTDQDASDIVSDDSNDSRGSLNALRHTQAGTNPQAAAVFSEEGVGIDRVDFR
jgi:hypothetical protein